MTKIKTESELLLANDQCPFCEGELQVSVDDHEKGCIACDEKWLNDILIKKEEPSLNLKNIKGFEEALEGEEPRSEGDAAIQKRIKSLESQVGDPDVLDQARIENKLEAYRECLLLLPQSPQVVTPITDEEIEKQASKKTLPGGNFFYAYIEGAKWANGEMMERIKPILIEFLKWYWESGAGLELDRNLAEDYVSAWLGVRGGKE